jgi:hypothetical protein
MKMAAAGIETNKIVSQHFAKVRIDTVKIGFFSYRRFLMKVNFAKKGEQNLSPIVSKNFIF